jgi:NAD(P)-dependent dehydrogenase (short-subunit alcohol dehydrogenase family)
LDAAFADGNIAFLCSAWEAVSFYYTHLMDDCRWWVEWRALPGTELAGTELAGAAAGLLLGKLDRRGLLVPVLLGLVVTPFWKPLVRPLRVDSLRDRWSDGVCLQSTPSTCGPACVAPLARSARLRERISLDRLCASREGRNPMTIEGGPMLVCLVTGAAHGIGKATASALLQAGWTVGILDRDEGKGRAAQAELSRLGTCEFFSCSVAVEDEVHRTVQRALDRWQRLDGLVNNAGRMGQRKPLEELTLGDWDEILDTNLTGAFLLARECAPALRKSRGAIVNIASTRATMSEPNTFAYSASKGGIVALTHALAASLAPDVRVNSISPGWIDVAGQPLSPEDHAQHWAGRVGQPHDVADMAIYLLGPKAGFITGANMVIDGGMTRKMTYSE